LRNKCTIIESALDDIYVSVDQNTKINGRKMDTSSTDHLPLIAEVCIKVQQGKKQKQFGKGA
jgi:hypothetical protein